LRKAGRTVDERWRCSGERGESATTAASAASAASGGSVSEYCRTFAKRYFLVCPPGR
jgi:hypothetical protein